jgi:polyhydroxyalkanoate synthesis regulator phasin
MDAEINALEAKIDALAALVDGIVSAMTVAKQTVAIDYTPKIEAMSQSVQDLTDKLNAAIGG